MINVMKRPLDDPLLDREENSPAERFSKDKSSNLPWRCQLITDRKGLALSMLSTCT